MSAWSTDWLLYLAIPLGAAVIGYFTNWVAIWMLFRPHREKRVLGVRIPFTPGLIPSRRGEMAERMGAAVARHLITQESIAARIDTPEVRRKVEELLGRYLDEWLRRDLGSVESLIPERFRDDWQALKERLRGRIREQIARTLQDPRTEAFLREKLEERVQAALQKPLRELLPGEWLDRLPEQLADGLTRFVEDPAFEERVRTFLDERLEAFLTSDKPLKEYVPERVREAAYEKVRELLPLLLEKLVAVLEDERLKKRIKIHLYELVDQLFAETFREDSLWDQLKFGLMEAFVISTDEIKLKIDRTVEEAAPRLARLLQAEEVQLKIQRALLSAVDSFLERRISDFRLEPAVIEDLKERASEAVLAAARSPTVREQLVSLLERKIREHGGRPVGEILPSWGWEPERVAQTLSRGIGDLLRQEATVEALAEFLDRQVDEWLKKPLGRLGDHIPEESVERAKAWLSEQLIRLLIRETPKMLEALDVQQIVRSQVDELSLPEVEKLILAITSRQLRAITGFGALLGFLIGLLQVAILLARGGFSS